MCMGLRKSVVAKQLGLSTSAVRLYTTLLFKRLAVKDRIGVPVRLVLADRELRSRRKR